MAKKTFLLDEQNIVLPRGTRVVLRIDIRGEDGYLHKRASMAIVRGVTHHTYSLETPGGRAMLAQRDQIAVQRQDLLADMGRRQWSFRRLADEVILSSVVGSQAWGLADEHSDEDVRGCFVAPFDDYAGLWTTPED
ncbi:MAG: nucleotidyltransferase domain-containing protein, partial [Myxococcota bacterium]